MVKSLNCVLNARNGCDKISNQSDFWGSTISWTMAGLDWTGLLHRFKNPIGDFDWCRIVQWRSPAECYSWQGKVIECSIRVFQFLLAGHNQHVGGPGPCLARPWLRAFRIWC